MELFEFLMDTTLGKCILTMLVSMVPIIELRGGIPFGVAMGLPYHLAFPFAVVGNVLPAPFIIVYIRKIFLMMRRYLPKLNHMVDKLETKAHLKGQQVSKYKYLGLFLFVAIPLPVDRLPGGGISGYAPEKGIPCCIFRGYYCWMYYADPDSCGNKSVSVI